jgi:hypothetical protein
VSFKFRNRGNCSSVELSLACQDSFVLISRGTTARTGDGARRLAVGDEISHAPTGIAAIWSAHGLTRERISRGGLCG